jgi:MbtH protein
MSWDEEEDLTNYLVVVNHEEQYSIWPDYKDIPNGWTHVGESGLKQQCLEYIEKVWTDMRPLSLRKQMEEWEKNNKTVAAEAKESKSIKKTENTKNIRSGKKETAASAGSVKKRAKKKTSGTKKASTTSKKRAKTGSGN